jgi:hypothetical protein
MMMMPVRTKVARSESTPLMPILAKMAVNAAKTADSNAQKTRVRGWTFDTVVELEPIVDEPARGQGAHYAICSMFAGKLTQECLRSS